LKTNTIQIGVSRDTPQFLVEANSAITNGQIERAKELINNEGIEEVRRMAEKNPSRTDVMFMLAVLLHRTKQFDKAEQWLKKILEVEENVLVYNELAMMCNSMERFSEDIEYLRKALELDPDNTGVLYNLGMRLIESGRHQECVDLLRKAAEKSPDNAVFRSDLLYCLHYIPDMDSQTIFEEHKQWAKIHAPANKTKTIHDNDPNPNRKLRIGYISPNFRRHSVAYFFEPLLDEHNREEFEIYGYGNVEGSDQITDRLKGKFHSYRDVYGMDDKTTANMIEQDKIDILVDLAGHTAHNRLLVMAFKPAPIQVTYLGYINTTGMSQIDYRLTDELAEPPELQKFYTEKLAYLPKGHHCYKPEETSLLQT